MKQIQAKPIEVAVDKIVVMSDMGVGVESMAKPKQDHIDRLIEKKKWYPIVITPIKDSGYYILADGWHRLQAAKKLGMKTMKAFNLSAEEGLTLGKFFVLGEEMFREGNDWVILTHGKWNKVLKARKQDQELQIELVDNDNPLLITSKDDNEKD